MKSEKYCNDCEFLNMTEEYQEKNGLQAHDHKCTLFNEKLLHRGHYPEIPRLDKCIEYNFVEELLEIIDNGKIRYRTNKNNQARCLICGEVVDGYEHEIYCCDGMMCGCRGEPLPNKYFPVCKAHNVSGDVVRTLMHLIDFHEVKMYTLKYAIDLIIDEDTPNRDLLKILICNWEHKNILEGYSL